MEPASQATFLRFLFEWQHLTPGTKLDGEAGLLDIIEQLQGFEAASGAVETELLPIRMSPYQDVLLDHLCLGGEVVWGRVSRPNTNGQSLSTRGPLSRTTPITLVLRESLDWLWDHPADEELDQSGVAGEILDLLSKKGACFLPEMISATRRLPADVEEALWRLAAAGRVTADGLEPLRRRIQGNLNKGRRAPLLKRNRNRRFGGQRRWSLLEADHPQEDPVEARGRQLLLRYGILFPELLAREPMAPRWRDLVRVLRTLEARGEIRGGRFVSGFVGEQFAMPEAVEMLRKVGNQELSGQLVAVSACDPLNLAGILTPGARTPALLGNRLVYQDGVPIASLESGQVIDRSGGDSSALPQARSLLYQPPSGQSTGRARRGLPDRFGSTDQGPEAVAQSLNR